MTPSEEKSMNVAQKQVIAQMVACTVQVLELHRLEYQVTHPKQERRKGNKSPRVIHVYGGDVKPENRRLTVYNSAGGHTWAYNAKGRPIKDIGTIQDLSDYLGRHPI